MKPHQVLPSSQVSTVAGPGSADHRTSFLLSPLPLGLPIQSTETIGDTPNHALVYMGTTASCPAAPHGTAAMPAPIIDAYPPQGC